MVSCAEALAAPTKSASVRARKEPECRNRIGDNRVQLYPRFSFADAGCEPDRYRVHVSQPPLSPDAADRELEVQLQTELALAKAEREATTLRTSERRRARFRFLLIVLVLLAIAATFAYLSLQTLRSAFGA